MCKARKPWAQNTGPWHSLDRAIFSGSSSVIAELCPDVVFLNVELPDGNGIDALREIQEMDAKIPVVIITATGASETVIEAVKLGALDYLTKPLNFDQVSRVLDHALVIRRLMKEPVEVAPPVGVSPSSGDVLVGRCPAMELVGAFVFHEEKVGLDAGELAGIEPIGVLATNDMEQMLAVDADVVLYNPPLERYDEIIPILASGKNVISIMAGWNPARHPRYPDIVRACEKGGVSLYGTGLNPGLSYELALLASSCCTDIDLSLIHI